MAKRLLKQRGRVWRHVQPNSLKDAIELCTHYALEKHNKSVDHIKDRVASGSKSTLYRWLAEGGIPANQILAFEDCCGIPLVTKYLAASHGCLLVQIPTGRKAEAKELTQLQINLANVGKQLLMFHNGEANANDTLAVLLGAMENLAYHKNEVEQHQQPSLLGGTDQYE